MLSWQLVGKAPPADGLAPTAELKGDAQGRKNNSWRRGLENHIDKYSTWGNAANNIKAAPASATTTVVPIQQRCEVYSDRPRHRVFRLLRCCGLAACCNRGAGANGKASGGFESKLSVNFVMTWLRKFPSRSKRIDVISRIFFPLMFALFNLVYWTTYLFRDEQIGLA